MATKYTARQFIEAGKSAGKSREEVEAAIQKYLAKEGSFAPDTTAQPPTPQYKPPSFGQPDTTPVPGAAPSYVSAPDQPGYQPPVPPKALPGLPTTSREPTGPDLPPEPTTSRLGLGRRQLEDVGRNVPQYDSREVAADLGPLGKPIAATQRFIHDAPSKPASENVRAGQVGLAKIGQIPFQLGQKLFENIPFEDFPGLKSEQQEAIRSAREASGRKIDETASRISEAEKETGHIGRGAAATEFVGKTALGAGAATAAGFLGLAGLPGLAVTSLASESPFIASALADGDVKEATVQGALALAVDALIQGVTKVPIIKTRILKKFGKEISDDIADKLSDWAVKTHKIGVSRKATGKAKDFFKLTDNIAPKIPGKQPYVNTINQGKRNLLSGPVAKNELSPIKYLQQQNLHWNKTPTAPNAVGLATDRAYQSVKIMDEIIDDAMSVKKIELDKAVNAGAKVNTLPVRQGYFDDLKELRLEIVDGKVVPSEGRISKLSDGDIAELQSFTDILQKLSGQFKDSPQLVDDLMARLSSEINWNTIARGTKDTPVNKLMTDTRKRLRMAMGDAIGDRYNTAMGRATEVIDSRDRLRYMLGERIGSDKLGDYVGPTMELQGLNKNGAGLIKAAFASPSKKGVITKTLMDVQGITGIPLFKEAHAAAEAMRAFGDEAVNKLLSTANFPLTKFGAMYKAGHATLKKLEKLTTQEKYHQLFNYMKLADEANIKAGRVSTIDRLPPLKFADEGLPSGQRSAATKLTTMEEPPTPIDPLEAGAPETPFEELKLSPKSKFKTTPEMEGMPPVQREISPEELLRESSGIPEQSFIDPVTGREMPFEELPISKGKRFQAPPDRSELFGGKKTSAGKLAPTETGIQRQEAVAQDLKNDIWSVVKNKSDRAKLRSGSGDISEESQRQIQKKIKSYIDQGDEAIRKYQDVDIEFPSDWKTIRDIISGFTG